MPERARIDVATAPWPPEPKESRGLRGERRPKLGASRDRVLQPVREISANLCKPMQVNESKKAFICFHKFFGIGTLQWVTREKNEKTPLPPARLSGCGPNMSNSMRLHSDAQLAARRNE
jgi:hypothetical protein